MRKQVKDIARDSRNDSTNQAKLQMSININNTAFKLAAVGLKASPIQI